MTFHRTAGAILCATAIAGLLTAGSNAASASASHRTYCGHGTSAIHSHNGYLYRAKFRSHRYLTPNIHVHTYAEQQHAVAGNPGWVTTATYTRTCPY